MKNAVILLLCIFLLTSCGRKVHIPLTESGRPLEDFNTKYVPYAEIPDGYSLENAKTDGLVVFENSDITFGQSVWDSFLDETQSGEPSMVRAASYFTLDDPSQYSPEYYESVKDMYPQLFIHDLIFDGEQYIFYSVQNDTEYNKTYKYLKRIVDVPTYYRPEYTERILYILVNDSEVTYEQLMQISLSCDHNDRIDWEIVYSDFKYIE